MEAGLEGGAWAWWWEEEEHQQADQSRQSSFANIHNWWAPARKTLARKTGAHCSQVRRRKVKKGSYCYLSSFLFAPLTAVNCHKSTLGLWRQPDLPKIQVRLRNDPPSSETVNHSSMNIERSTIYFTHLFEPNQIFYFCRLFPHFADLFWMPIVYFMNNQND